MDSEPASAAQPKTEYELLRDKKKAEMLKALEPVLRARRQLDDDRAGQKEAGARGAQRKTVTYKESARGDREAGVKRKSTRVGGRLKHTLSAMTSARGSSSEATESHDNDLAASMIKLAIACVHAQQQSAKDAAGAEVEAKRVDSSDSNASSVERLKDRRKKRRMKQHLPVSPVSVTRAQANTPPPSPAPAAPLQVTTAGAPTAGPGGWSWFPGQWYQAQASQPPAPWSAPQPTTYPGPWVEVPPVPTAQPEDRSSRRKRRAAYDLESKDRSGAGKKPNRVAVNDVGEVDAACEGKNAWDRCIRDLVPKILDMSVVEWSQQSPHALKRLKEALDSEFEYLGQPLSMEGFRAAITRYLKSERFRLKSKWLKNPEEKCPLHVDDDQWVRLIEYWQTPAQQTKSQKMQEARQNVTNYALVGRKGKVGKDPTIREGGPSCGGIADAVEAESESVDHSGKLSLRSTVQSLKQDVDMKFNQVMATTSAQTQAIEDLRLMFQSFTGRFKDKTEGSPSMTHSALDVQDSGGFKDLEVAGKLPDSRKKTKSVAEVVDRRHRNRKLTATGAHEDGTVRRNCELARKEQVTLSSDSELPNIERSIPDSQNCEAAERQQSPTEKQSTVHEAPNLYSMTVSASDTGMAVTEEASSIQKSVVAEEGVVLGVEVVALDPATCTQGIFRGEGAMEASMPATDKEGLHTDDSEGHKVAPPEVANAPTCGLEMQEPEEPAVPEGALAVASRVQVQEQELGGQTLESEGDVSAEGLEPDGADEGGDRGARSSEPQRPPAAAVPSALSKKAKKPLKSPLKSALTGPSSRNVDLYLTGERFERIGKPHTRETRSKVASAPEKKKPDPSKKWTVGTPVFFMNPRAVRMKVARGTISGVSGQHKFHFKEIPEGWCKVDVTEVLQEGVCLMYPNDAAEQTLIEHVLGTNAFWKFANMKVVS